MGEPRADAESSHGASDEDELFDVKQQIEQLDGAISAEKEAIKKYKQFRADHDVVEQTKALKEVQSQMKMKKHVPLSPQARNADLKLQGYFKKEQEELRRVHQERERLMLQMYQVDAMKTHSSHSEAQRIYQRGAQLLLNKVYRLKAPEGANYKEKLHALSNSKLDLANVNLQELVDNGGITFEQTAQQSDHSIATKLSKRPKSAVQRVSTSQGRTGMLQRT